MTTADEYTTSMRRIGLACDAVSAACADDWGSDEIMSIVAHPQAVSDMGDVRCGAAAEALADADLLLALKVVWADGLVLGALVAAIDSVLADTGGD